MGLDCEMIIAPLAELCSVTRKEASNPVIAPIPIATNSPATFEAPVIPISDPEPIQNSNTDEDASSPSASELTNNATVEQSLEPLELSHS